MTLKGSAPTFGERAESGMADSSDGAPGDGSAEAVRLTAWVRGRVQGVGFRWWTRARALELGLTGSASNLVDGRVEVIAEGPRGRCEALLVLLSEQPPRDLPGNSPSAYRRPGRVVAVTHRWSGAHGTSGFVER
jgi:acylphosphatase